MNKTNYSFIFFLLIVQAFTSKAQTPYSTLRLNTPSFFTGQTQLASPFTPFSPVNVLAFDSIHLVGNDTVYIGFYTPADSTQMPVTCMDDAGQSWFGSAAVKKSSQLEVYVNDNLDSVYFEPTATLGKTFRMFDYPNGDYLEATVISIQPFNLLGAADSLKSLTLAHKDQFGVLVADPINTDTISVARDSGWINFFELYNFPYVLEPKTRVPAINMPDRFEAYNFDIGDRFQYMISNYTVFGPTTPPSIQEVNILAKQYFGATDSVEYIAEFKTMSFTFNPIPQPHLDTTLIITTDTIVYTDLHQQFWSGWPMQSLYLNNEVSCFVLDTGYCTGTGIIGLSTGIFNYDFAQSCYMTPFEPVIITRRFAEGLGEVFYENDALSIGGSRITKELIWYQKEDFQCGNQNTFTGIDELRNAFPFELRPNPAHEQLILTHSGIEKAEQIVIGDISGKKILGFTPDSNSESRVDISALAPGNYLCTIITSAGRSTRVFVKN
ncbi:MAG: T9SS type A sorting domain-containing protein [Bacteroidia bacterium]|jgi:hypothetical protein|nr:T9SS type A sorting domain-containing protein [Bacteroidia bacterium]